MNAHDRLTARQALRATMGWAYSSLLEIIPEPNDPTRETLAALAMQGFLARGFTTETLGSARVLAEYAYGVADAMMAERAKRADAAASLDTPDVFADARRTAQRFLDAASVGGEGSAIDRETAERILRGPVTKL